MTACCQRSLSSKGGGGKAEVMRKELVVLVGTNAALLYMSGEKLHLPHSHSRRKFLDGSEKQDSKKRPICLKSPAHRNSSLLLSLTCDFVHRRFWRQIFTFAYINRQVKKSKAEHTMQAPLHTPLRPSPPGGWSSLHIHSLITHVWKGSRLENFRSEQPPYESSVGFHIPRKDPSPTARRDLQSQPQLLTRSNLLACGLVTLPKCWVNPSLDFNSEPDSNLVLSEQLQRLLYTRNNWQQLMVIIRLTFRCKSNGNWVIRLEELSPIQRCRARIAAHTDSKSGKSVPITQFCPEGAELLWQRRWH